MCDIYSPSKFDITTQGREGWKIVRGRFSGPCRGTPIAPGWMKAADRESADRESERLGFHGFCFFFDKEDAEHYAKVEWRGHIMPIVPVRVKGRIKRAKVGKMICYLAEYIKFEKVPKS